MFPLTNIMVSTNSTIFSAGSPHNWDNTTLMMHCCFIIVRPSLMTFLTSLLAPKILRLFRNSNQIFSQDSYLFLIEFLLLIISEICFLTVFSHLSQFFIITMLLLIIYFLYYKYYFPYSLDITELIHMPIKDTHRSYITKVKTLTNLLTSIAILAVDFNIFPTHLSKTDHFGYSLMDTGVGLFVIINGLTSYETKTNFKPNFVKSNMTTLKSSIPLIVFGILRAVAVHLLNYSVNIHEYGKHWNFFLTLALVKIIGTFILSILNPKNAFVLALVVIGSHESALYSGLQEWILSDTAPRTDFLSANREGIISTSGYVAIYLMAVAYSRFIKSKDETLLKNFQLLFKQITTVICFWTVTFVTKDIFLCSRRMANLGYFLWINSLCFSILALMLFIELILFAINMSIIQQKKTHSYLLTILTPIIFEAINFNGLAFFLISNLLTGFVNMSIHTRACNYLTSLFILIVYMFVNCIIAFWLFKKKINIKFMISL